jgi:hypothetical protein
VVFGGQRECEYDLAKTASLPRQFRLQNGGMNPSPFVTAYLIVLGLVGVGLALPLLMGKMKRNKIFGFRTPLTLSSDEIWYPANRMAGTWILGWGVMNLVLGAIHLACGPFPQVTEVAIRMAPFTTLPLIAVGLMIWVERKFSPARKS